MNQFAPERYAQQLRIRCVSGSCNQKLFYISNFREPPADVGFDRRLIASNSRSSKRMRPASSVTTAWRRISSLVEPWSRKIFVEARWIAPIVWAENSCSLADSFISCPRHRLDGYRSVAGLH